MKKPTKHTPCMSIYTRMVNEDPSTTNTYDIESLEGENAYLSGSFTASQLRIVAAAMDELRDVKDIQSSAEYYYANRDKDGRLPE